MVVSIGSAGAAAGLYSMLVSSGDPRGVVVQASDHTRTLERFLADVERKAFKIAQLALRNDDDALDAVQDAMLSLVKTYGQRPSEEWKPLFYRILDNRVRDMQRRRATRGRFMAWLPGASADDREDDYDPLADARSEEPLPVRRLEMDEAMVALEAAVARLPERQRQAFLLRSLEGLDVAETASAMACSEGSVKTHYFRALQTLRAELGEFWS